jgi:hypothetical protein
LERRGKYATLSIPKELFDKTQALIDGTGFRSVTEYVVFLLRESLTMKRGEGLKERLKALGYVS